MKVRKSIIAAIGKNRELGKAGGEKLLWHVPEDFAYFKAVTLGKPVIMGYNTYKAMGRLLPHRPNIILTKEDMQIEGATVVHSLSEAYKIAEATAVQLGVDEFFNIGGASVYEQGLGDADRLYLTRIDSAFPEATVFFPPYADTFTRVVELKEGKNADYSYTFITLEK